CIDIAGAIAGSLCFALSSFLGLSPAAQIIVVALIILFNSRIMPRPAFRTAAIFLALSAVFAFLPSFTDVKSSWSPYARIDVEELRVPQKYVKTSGTESGAKPANPTDLIGILLHSNHGFQQVFTLENKLDLNDDGKKVETLQHLARFLDVRR